MLFSPPNKRTFLARSVLIHAPHPLVFELLPNFPLRLLDLPLLNGPGLHTLDEFADNRVGEQVQLVESGQLPGAADLEEEEVGLGLLGDEGLVGVAPAVAEVEQPDGLGTDPHAQTLEEAVVQLEVGEGAREGQLAVPALDVLAIDDQLEVRPETVLGRVVGLQLPQVLLALGRQQHVLQPHPREVVQTALEQLVRQFVAPDDLSPLVH